MTEDQRLKHQLDFIVEVDKLKGIYRQNVVIDSNKNENDAEHSWHISLMAMLLREYFVHEETDILKSIEMLLIHDLVEIDAGDTFCYDEKGYLDKAEREQKAAERIFGMLPEDQAGKVFSLWKEFEEQTTPEAIFASCMDRFQPLLLNINTKGHTWQKPGVDSQKVLKRNELLKDNMPALWSKVEEMVEDSIQKGYLKR